MGLQRIRHVSVMNNNKDLSQTFSLNAVFRCPEALLLHEFEWGKTYSIVHTSVGGRIAPLGQHAALALEHPEETVAPELAC